MLVVIVARAAMTARVVSRLPGAAWPSRQASGPSRSCCQREVDLQHEPEQSGGEDGQANPEGRVRQAGCEDEQAAGKRVGEENEGFDRPTGEHLVSDDGVQVEGDRDEGKTEQRSRGAGERDAEVMPRRCLTVSSSSSSPR